MKYFLTILFFVFAVNAIAQNNSFVKYYDSTWVYTTKEKANFYTEFKRVGYNYLCTSYYLPSNKLYSKSMYVDTLFQKGVGTIVNYYETGEKKDSAFFSPTGKLVFNYGFYKNGILKDSSKQDADGLITESFLFYENGKLFVHETYFPNEKTEAFDEAGNKMPNYIYQREAEFKGGMDKWIKYLTNNLKSKIPVKKGAPPGLYSVIVKFTITENGDVTDVSAENDPGYGTKEEAIRVLEKSPKWNPAIFKNKKVEFHHKQSITFQVSNE